LQTILGIFLEKVIESHENKGVFRVYGRCPMAMCHSEEDILKRYAFD